MKVRLDIVEGPMEGASFVFEQHDTFLFGRNAECHACLPDDTCVSRYHFLLEVKPPDARLRDLGSTNGTFVNGECYRQEAAPETPLSAAAAQVDLENGDAIQVGQTLFRFHTVEADDGEPVFLARCSLCNRQVFGRIRGVKAEGYICPMCRMSLREGETNETPASVDRSKESTVTMARVPWEEEEELPFIPGFTLGRAIGRGSLGPVYRARRKEDNAPVAVKILPPLEGVEPTQRQTFLNEITTLAALEHPNVLPVESHGLAQEHVYLVTEYCKRGNVGDSMRRHGGAIPVETAAGMLKQALKGLAYGHSKGLIHGDLKPRNLLVAHRGGQWHVKLGDFGLARSCAKAGLGGMRMTGAYAGSFPYMPPEQVTRYAQLDPVSDLWSVAAVFYRMVTGSCPRKKSPGLDPLQVVLEGEIVPILQRNPAVPVPLANVIDQALSLDPAARYDTADQFLEAIRDAQHAAGDAF